jgi:hypothetical protein
MGAPRETLIVRVGIEPQNSGGVTTETGRAASKVVHAVDLLRIFGVSNIF